MSLWTGWGHPARSELLGGAWGESELRGDCQG